MDAFGNVLKSAAIGYGRPQPDLSLPVADRAKQTQTLVTYTENGFTNPIAADDAYRTPLPCETRTYELTGYTPMGSAGRFQIPDLVRSVANSLAHIFDSEITYEDQPTSGKQHRLIEHVRTLYRKDDLSALLPLGVVESLALPGESYQLAFTPGLLAQVYQRTPENQPSEPLLPNPANILAADVPGGQVADRGGYVDLDGNNHWWIPSGRVFFSPNPNDDAVVEMAHASQHFFLPQRFRDPFGQTTTVTYDTYDLLTVETRDPLANRVTIGERDAGGNLVTAGNDYRVLQPRLVMDPNRNRTAVAFDALGMVVGTAVMGKPEENLGDSLAGFEADLTDVVILDHLANPLADRNRHSAARHYAAGV